MLKGHHHTEETKQRISKGLTGRRHSKEERLKAYETMLKRRPDLKATEHPTVIDIAWAAGIYEGEGWCSHCCNRDMVGVSQKRRWILDKLRSLFGGNIYPKNKVGNKNKLFTWEQNACRARGFLMTVYSFLSPWRKEQARRCLMYYKGVKA